MYIAVTVCVYTTTIEIRELAVFGVLRYRACTHPSHPFVLVRVRIYPVAVRTSITSVATRVVAKIYTLQTLRVRLFAPISPVSLKLTLTPFSRISPLSHISPLHPSPSSSTFFGMICLLLLR